MTEIVFGFVLFVGLGGFFEGDQVGVPGDGDVSDEHFIDEFNIGKRI